MSDPNVIFFVDEDPRGNSHDPVVRQLFGPARIYLIARYGLRSPRSTCSENKKAGNGNRQNRDLVLVHRRSSTEKCSHSTNRRLGGQQKKPVRVRLTSGCEKVRVSLDSAVC